MKLSNELSISTLIEIIRKVLHFNIFKAFYLRIVSLMNRLGAYGKRTNKYIDCFRPYVNNAKVIVDPKNRIFRLLDKMFSMRASLARRLIILAVK